jgi:hypothetical protein
MIRRAAGEFAKIVRIARYHGSVVGDGIGEDFGVGYTLQADRIDMDRVETRGSRQL